MSDYISEDNVVLILMFLPVKSLLRFRCVCKGWKELIDSATLLNDHLAVQNPRLIVEYGESEEFLVVDPRNLSIDTLPCPVGFQRDPFKSISIIGTLHGVVCLCDWDRHLHIWNPSIRKSFTLTLPDDFYCDIADEPWDCYGFWIDPSTKEFKILMLLSTIHADEDVSVFVNEVHLYSSKRHGWSVIPQGELGEWESLRESTAVMIGGVGHWLGVEINDRVILSFDFKQECFDFIETNGVECSRATVPCHWQGKLSLLCWEEKFRHRCDLYSRQEGNSWVNMFGFDLCAPTPVVLVFWPLEEMRRDLAEGNGRVVAAIRHEQHIPEDELVLYDAKIGCIPLKRGLINCFLVNMAYDFVESLLFP